MGRLQRWAALALVASAPVSAQASNNLHERTKVVWDEAGACGITVVRSEDPTVTLAYTLPDVNEDGIVDTCDDDPTPQGCAPAPNPVPGVDEVPDSRRHQFFASCRSRALDDPLPNWIDAADLEAAAQVETCCVPNECGAGMCPLVDPDTVDDGDRLDASPDWSCCTHAISKRRPITVAQAAGGVTWDTSEVPEGVYMVDGYTWEPPYNLWSRRPGFVKVIDEAGAADRFPAAAIMAVEDEQGPDGDIDGCEVVAVRGCVAAEPGATLDLWWRESRPDARVWHRVLADVPVEGDSFDIAWQPHDLPAGNILVRVDVRGEHGSYTAHAPVALKTLGTSQCAEAPAPDAVATDDTDNVDPVECRDDAGPRCDCARPRQQNRAAWWALGIVLLWRRRLQKSPLARPGSRW